MLPADQITSDAEARLREALTRYCLHHTRQHRQDLISLRWQGIKALQNGIIGGAALDVTDPEPLPEGHPLWSLPNCIITPHVGNTPAMAVPLLSERITTNVRRFDEGEALVGPVHVDLGY